MANNNILLVVLLRKLFKQDDACAEIPSPSPVKAIFSSVVALDAYYLNINGQGRRQFFAAFRRYSEYKRGFCAIMVMSALQSV